MGTLGRRARLFWSTPSVRVAGWEVSAQELIPCNLASVACKESSAVARDTLKEGVKTTAATAATAATATTATTATTSGRPFLLCPGVAQGVQVLDSLEDDAFH